MNLQEMVERSGLSEQTVTLRLSILNRLWNKEGLWNNKKGYPMHFYTEIANGDNFKTIDGKLYHVSELEIIGIKKIIFDYRIK